MDMKASQRDVLDQIVRCARANPFGAERITEDARLLGGNAPEDEKERSKAIAAFVADFLGSFPQRARFDQASGELQERLFIAHLLDVYFQLVPDFDDLVDKQLAMPEASLPVPFYPRAIKDMEARGFEPERARRVFEIFFQFQRAVRFLRQFLPGRSQPMVEFRATLWRNLFSDDLILYESTLWNRMDDFSVLILGETGTGKGAAARTLGGAGFIPFDEKAKRFSEPFTQAFVAINLSAYPETLIESELFGHRKGAFTGAIEDHAGAFRRCRPYGVVFLDEIGDVRVPVQIKLLQVLQDRTYTPVGGRDDLPFNGRVIAATHQPIEDLRREGRFRNDFFYRLSSDVIRVPTLRERVAADPDELTQLVSVLLMRTLGDVDGRTLDQVCSALHTGVPSTYGWPGNVRELEQAVRRIVITGEYRGDPLATGQAQSDQYFESGIWSAQELLTRYCRMLYDRWGTYEEVARRAELDRRTVKKYIEGPSD